MAKLDGTQLQLLRQVQKLEQGMGRGVRSSDDYCVVLLLGARLTQLVHLPSARSKFTAATQAQLKLAREVGLQAMGKPLNELVPIMNYCLEQNSQWLAASRNAVANAPDTAASYINPATPMIRRAFDLAREHKFDDACNQMELAANGTSENAERGYYKEQLATYKHHVNPADSQMILASAVSLNYRVTRPIAGIGYQKLKPYDADQAKAASDFLGAKCLEPNDLVIWLNGLLEELRWDTDQDATSRFEAAVQELGRMLGFGSQRPEQELGKGPDNLWAIGGLSYLVIECKSGASSDSISKKDTNQLNGSMTWFQNTYDPTCTATPIIIHPSNIFEKQSSPPPTCKMIDKLHLQKLRGKLSDLGTALRAESSYKDPKKVAEILNYFGFNSGSFVQNFSGKFKVFQS